MNCASLPGILLTTVNFSARLISTSLPSHPLSQLPDAYAAKQARRTSEVA